MTALDDDAGSSHFGALATWLDAVHVALAETEVVVLTVEGADLPGALTVEVRPDGEGIKTSQGLIRWAEPDIALQVNPHDQDASFWLYLDGDRRVIISCGPPLPPRLPEPYYRGMDPADRERIEQRLVEVATAMMAGDPGWEPISATADPDLLIDGYLTEYDVLDSRATIEAVIDGPPVRRALWDLQQDRAIEHRRKWATDAESIAQTILGGPDGPMLRSATMPVHREHAELHLRKIDEHCASKNAAEPIAKAMSRIAKRPQPSRFVRISGQPPEWAREVDA